MKTIKSKELFSLFIILTVLILDQFIKIEVKTNMYYGESIHITDWFYIYFVENSGIAFGMQIIPKMVQTISRIIFASVIIWYITILIKANYKQGYLVCISLIFAGAVGNIIDSIFYGAIFSESTYREIATFVPLGQGYEDWLHGKVVDMFYFPLVEFNWPNWMPAIGGNKFVFFSPIFNFADASICCGISALVLFYTKTFNSSFGLIKYEFKQIMNQFHSLIH